jgi:heme a synthase
MLFRRLGIITIVILYLLILAGGIVRSTGSGMGCPDWPKCFGTWVPPTDVSQLPDNYQAIFGAKLKGEVTFNVYKTWTEYINRLLGVLTGFAIFLTVLAAIPFLRRDKPVFYLSFLGLVLVAFQGWLGSKVVSSELSPLMVTLHMLVAIIIVFVLLYALARSYSGIVTVERISERSRLNVTFVLAIILGVLQVLIGTQVREAIDEVALRLGYTLRETWIDNLGITFWVHRSFSLIVLAVHAYLIYVLRQHTATKGLMYRFSYILLAIVVAEIATGAAMAYFAIPAYLQPVHLTLAILMLGVQFVAALLLNADRVFNSSTSTITPARVF